MARRKNRFKVDSIKYTLDIEKYLFEEYDLNAKLKGIFTAYNVRDALVEYLPKIEAENKVLLKQREKLNEKTKNGK